MGRVLLLATILLLLSACSVLLGRPAGQESTRPAGNYVELLDSACDEAAGGLIAFTGRVTNTHPDRSLTLVQLRGALLSADGNEVSSNWGLTKSDEIAPGGRSDFRFYIDDSPEGVSCRLTVESALFTR